MGEYHMLLDTQDNLSTNFESLKMTERSVGDWKI